MELVRAFQQLELELHFRLLIFESRLLVREYSTRKRDVLTKWHFYSTSFIPDIYNYIHITDDIRHTHTLVHVHVHVYTCTYLQPTLYTCNIHTYKLQTNTLSTHLYMYMYMYIPTNRHYTCTHTNKHSIYMSIHVPINRHVHMYKQTL